MSRRILFVRHDLTHDGTIFMPGVVQIFSLNEGALRSIVIQKDFTATASLYGHSLHHVSYC